MDFLKEILGDELFEQVKGKLDAYNGSEENKDKQIKIGNLAGGEYVSKLKYDDLQALFDGKEKELLSANELIGELKKGTKGNEDLQGKVTAYETKVSELQEEIKKTKIESAVKVALLEAKASDIDYMMFKLGETGDLELDDKGNVKGISEKIESLKTQFPKQFETGKGGGNIDPNPLPGGDEGRDTEPESLADALRMQAETTN